MFDVGVIGFWLDDASGVSLETLEHTEVHLGTLGLLDDVWS